MQNKRNIKLFNNFFWIYKRIFDVVFSLLLLPVLVIIMVLLWILNPVFNKGDIFFIQKRMGKNCKAFFAIKFRSMKTTDVPNRSYYDPLESERITPLGKFIRKTRLDEVPQILNVLKGEMSLIGPRPDYYEHDIEFVKNIENYKLRHEIRPGLSGLSQIRLGYAEGIEATRLKSTIDIYYIENAGFLLDTKIFFGTILSIIKVSGK
jgi:lipopolysaccharide/colanic/teichoic acid biosynthesis glycosyltransferase